MKRIYLTLAVLGAVVPYAFFLPYFQANGLDLSGFVGALFANGPAGGFTADLLIASFVFWLYMARERQAGRGPGLPLFIVLNLTIGLSCALPAYLYARESQGNH